MKYVVILGDGMAGYPLADPEKTAPHADCAYTIL